MIQINKDSSNDVVVTVSDSITLVNSIYLFEFKNDQDNSLHYFIAGDNSLYPERYNLFVVTETSSSPDPLIGEVSLNLTGFYSYRIFEQLSTTNLDPTLCDNTTPLEVGKVLVLGVGETEYEYTYNPTITVYQG
jgi:hypothetical protein